jgi:hypothetical protein
MDCSYCWTVKRDVFDIPMLIVMNVRPSLPIPDSRLIDFSSCLAFNGLSNGFGTFMDVCDGMMELWVAFWVHGTAAFAIGALI